MASFHYSLDIGGKEPRARMQQGRPLHTRFPDHWKAGRDKLGVNCVAVLTGSSSSVK